MVSVMDRVRNALNAFSREEESPFQPAPGGAFGGYSGISPSRPRLRTGTERSIISSVYTRMAIDIASVQIRHTRHDESDRYLEDIDSGLNNCLKVEANIDQGAMSFMLDVVLSLFDKGSLAIVPIDTTLDPRITSGYDIKTMRVGEIVQWYPNHIRVKVYNERIGERQEITVAKRYAAVVENPLYSVMNEPNSTLQRLIRKLSMLDSIDEVTSSGKLDLILQLPYVVKTEERRRQAEQRAKDIEFQLKSNDYGVAYTDGTEKVIQLNRPIENNLLGQIEYLTNVLYTQLGLTPEVMNGTANEAAMLNYNNRTIAPILTAITQAMARTFLTKTARSQGQAIDFFRDPFKLVPMSDLADMADKFTRNEIVTSNEFRGFIGMRPSKDPKADMLVNSNMPQAITGVGAPADGSAIVTPVVSDPSVEAPDPNAPADTSPLDSVDDSITAAFAAFGADPPAPDPTPPPSGGELDPDLVLSSLDELDKFIDDTFSGLEAE